MNTDEAIELLCAYGVPLDEEKFREALDMAISALLENPKLIKEAERWKAYFEDEVANEW